MEDLAVEAERHHTLLDAGACAVVDTDERAARLGREFLHLDDLLAVDLAEAAAEHRGVLAEDADLAAVDGAVAGDHTVAERALVSQSEIRAAVTGQCVEFDERSVVQQRQDALSSRQLALGVDLLDRRLTDRVQRLFAPPAQIGQLARGGMDIDLMLGRWLGNARHGEDRSDNADPPLRQV